NLPAEDPLVTKTMVSLAAAYRDTRRLSDALALFNEALTLQKTNLSPMHPDTRATMLQIALALRDAGRFDDAQALYRDLMSSVQPGTKADDMELAHVLDALGCCYLQQNDYIDAERILRQALWLHEKRAPAHWETSRTRSRLGCALCGQKKYAEAEPL